MRASHLTAWLLAACIATQAAPMGPSPGPTQQGESSNSAIHDSDFLVARDVYTATEEETTGYHTYSGRLASLGLDVQNLDIDNVKSVWYWPRQAYSDMVRLNHGDKNGPRAMTMLWVPQLKQAQFASSARIDKSIKKPTKGKTSRAKARYGFSEKEVGKTVADVLKNCLDTEFEDEDGKKHKYSVDHRYSGACGEIAAVARYISGRTKDLNLSGPTEKDFQRILQELENAIISTFGLVYIRETSRAGNSTPNNPGVWSWKGPCTPSLAAEKYGCQEFMTHLHLKDPGLPVTSDGKNYAFDSPHPKARTKNMDIRDSTPEMNSTSNQGASDTAPRAPSGLLKESDDNVSINSPGPKSSNELQSGAPEESQNERGKGKPRWLSPAEAKKRFVENGWDMDLDDPEVDIPFVGYPPSPPPIPLELRKTLIRLDLPRKKPPPVDKSMISDSTSSSNESDAGDDQVDTSVTNENVDPNDRWISSAEACKQLLAKGWDGDEDSESELPDYAPPGPPLVPPELAITLRQPDLPMVEQPDMNRFADTDNTTSTIEKPITEHGPMPIFFTNDAESNKREDARGTPRLLSPKEANKMFERLGWDQGDEDDPEADIPVIGHPPSPPPISLELREKLIWLDLPRKELPPDDESVDADTTCEKPCAERGPMPIFFTNDAESNKREDARGTPRLLSPKEANKMFERLGWDQGDEDDPEADIEVIGHPPSPPPIPLELRKTLIRLDLPRKKPPPDDESIDSDTTTTPEKPSAKEDLTATSFNTASSVNIEDESKESDDETWKGRILAPAEADKRFKEPGRDLDDDPETDLPIMGYPPSPPPIPLELRKKLIRLDLPRKELPPDDGSIDPDADLSSRLSITLRLDPDIYNALDANDPSRNDDTKEI